jgi:protein-L-isoaspartate(D-aspartate) O-methyltransferase
MPTTLEEKRLDMVRYQIEKRGIHDPRLLQALRDIPRHAFVSPADVDEAYDDHPLPIGRGQTISQPYIVALMTDLLNLKGQETVLEVGTGSGYQAAVLSMLVKQVHTVETLEFLSENAHAALQRLGICNVITHVGDGSLGWEEAAPYDGILVTAAAPRAPEPLLDQLAEGGRLVVPVGMRFHQDLEVWKKKEGRLTCERVLGVAFVPLLGAHGWKETEWE